LDTSRGQEFFEASCTAASEAFRNSEILRVEANIGKQPIIQMRDAPAKAPAR
jgi:hypothetical protein